MSSENDTHGIGDEQLRVGPGTQVLVSTTSMQQPLSLLPAKLSGNLLIVSSDTPATIEAELRERGIDPSRAGLVPVAGSDIEYDGPLWTSDPVVPDDLTGLSMRFTSALDALESGHGWVLFDSLNTLAMYANQDRVARFFDHVTATTRDRDLRGIYTVTPDAVEDDVYDTFQHCTDRVLENQ